MANFNVSLALRAQDQGFTAEVTGSRDELRDLKQEATATGQAIGSQISAGVSRAGTVLGRLRTIAATTGGSIRQNLRAGVGQLGLQIQDIAVQAQAGISPLTIFVQQGSQIAGAFGPAGAAIGAVVAVGGALASVLLRGEDATARIKAATEGFKDALDEANRALGEGATEADKLVKAYSGLSGTTQGLGVVKLREDLIDTRRATDEAREAFGGLVDEIASASELRLALGGSGLADVGGLGPGSGLAGQITRGQAEELQAAVAAFESGAITEVQLLSEIQRVLAGANVEAREFVRNLIETADTAETGRVSLEQLATAGTSIQALAAEGGVHLDRLGGSIDRVGEKVEQNKGIWEGWYQELVGGSVIPDTVTESEIWFDRMGASMTSTTREATANVTDAFIGLDTQVSGSLARMITSNKLALEDFANFSLDIATSVLQNLLQIGIQSGIAFAFAPSTPAPATGPGGLLVGGGVTSAGVGHGGGIAGELARQRLVPASLFADAQRYHGGGMVLRPNEVPIIAERGERITPAGQAGGPTTIVKIENHSGGAVEHRQSRGPAGQDMHTIIIRRVGDSIASGDQDRAMFARFGLRPAG